MAKRVGPRGLDSGSMKLPAVAVATLCVVASTKSLLASRGYEGPPIKREAKITCDTGRGVKDTEVTLPNTVVSVECNGSDTLKPTVVRDTTATKVCKTQSCEDSEVDLSTLCPAATMKGGDSTGKAIITIPQLPTSAEVFYMQCIHTDRSTVNCTAKISVQAAALQGPQSCAVGGDTVTLQVQQEGGKAHFACGEKLSLYPTEDTKALTAECTKVETVKDLTRRIITPGNYVELTVTKKGKKNLCYLCRKSEDMSKKDTVTKSDCKVLVQVSGSTPLLPRLAFALTLPCALTLLHFTP